MSYIDTIKKLPQVMTPGSSACQGCGGELITRRVMQLAGNNSVFAVPPGCMAGAGVDGSSYQNGCTAPIHITLLDNTASFMSGVSEMYQRKGRGDVNIVAIAGDGATADCGFQNLSGFNRQFKKRVGCSPAQYRRSAARPPEGEGKG